MDFPVIIKIFACSKSMDVYFVWIAHHLCVPWSLTSSAENLVSGAWRAATIPRSCCCTEAAGGHQAYRANIGVATGLISELCTTDAEQSASGGCARLLPTGNRKKVCQSGHRVWLQVGRAAGKEQA